MNLDKRKILWADDEIDLLRSHIIFLGQRGYAVTPVANGEDAISMVQKEPFDIVLLDEMMPGKDGLSTLSDIKDIDPNIPVVMITKNKEEHLMDEAIGKRIDDYLTKPVNPSQILSACKRILEVGQIRKDRAGKDYVWEFGQIDKTLSERMAWEDWVEIYSKLAEWDLEIEYIEDSGLKQLHKDQKRKCNMEFGKYVESRYKHWLQDDDPPILSVDVISEFVYPYLAAGKQVFFIVVDCLRLDQWLSIEPILSELYSVKRSYYYSILPTATPYSRNAIFSGLFPSQIEDKYPQLWRAGKEDEYSRNRHEHQFLDAQLSNMGLDLRPGSKYVKVLNTAEGNNLAKKINSFRDVPLVSAVYNFLDILIHGRSESEILQQIAPDEAALRSLAKSWFIHSPLFDMLKKIARLDAVVVLTTDHGSILGTRSALVYGDRHTSTSLRYKYGKNLRCDKRQALFIEDMEEYKLSYIGMRTNFIIAKEDYYFVYPTKLREYERYYKGNFQHGGISLEEMILPAVVMNPK